MYIKIFYLYRILGQLLPVYPVYLLMFQQKGLSISDISWLLIIWSLPGLLFEIPSSILADKWNRRNLLVAGRLLKGLCFFVWSIWSSFTGFAIGFILWGTGGALCSGTEEAWLYDALKANGNVCEFDKVWGKSTFYYQFTVGIASVIGSIIAAVSMQLTLYISIVSITASTAMAAMLPDYNTHTEVKNKFGLGEYFQVLKDGILFCLKRADISILVGFNITILVTAGVLDEYDQLIVRSMGVPLALVGLWGLFRYSMEAFGGRFAWRLKRILKRYHITKPASVQAFISVCAAIFIAITAAFPLKHILPIYVLYYFVLSAGKVLFTDTVQSEIQSEGRATVQSLTMMLEAPSGMLIYFLFGMAGKIGQLQGGLLTVSLWIIGFCLLFIFINARRKGGVVYEK